MVEIKLPNKLKKLWKNKPKLFIGMAIYGYLLKKWGELVFNGISQFFGFLSQVPLGGYIQIYIASIGVGVTAILIGDEVTEIISEVVKTIIKEIKKKI